MLRSNSAQCPASAVVEPQPEDAGGSIPKAVFSRQHFPSALAFGLLVCRVRGSYPCGETSFALKQP